MLIDSDAPSNWGNWTYVAGVGADPREDRYFYVVKQSKVCVPVQYPARPFLRFLVIF